MSTVVVTGANRGIGLELARLHIERGDDVIAGCRQPDAAKDLAALGPAAIMTVDVADETSVGQFTTAVGGTLGGATLDILYNNAGASGAAFGLGRGDGNVLDVPMDIVEGMIRLNGLSAATVSRGLVGHMAAGSKIANVSSQIGSMVVAKSFADLPYSASKAVMNMVTVQLAAKLADDGIMAVCFHPGWVRTDMGGPSADIAPAEAAAGMASVLDTLTMEQSGGFYRHDGSQHPW